MIMPIRSNMEGNIRGGMEIDDYWRSFRESITNGAPDPELRKDYTVVKSTKKKVDKQRMVSEKDNVAKSHKVRKVFLVNPEGGVTTGGGLGNGVPKRKPLPGVRHKDKELMDRERANISLNRKVRKHFRVNKEGATTMEELEAIFHRFKIEREDNSELHREIQSMQLEKANMDNRKVQKLFKVNSHGVPVIRIRIDRRKNPNRNNDGKRPVLIREKEYRATRKTSNGSEILILETRDDYFSSDEEAAILTESPRYQRRQSAKQNGSLVLPAISPAGRSISFHEETSDNSLRKFEDESGNSLPDIHNNNSSTSSNKED